MNPAVQPFSPSQVRHHRFCFCVPCRWGTWILSGTTGVVSGMVATANFLSLLSADTKPAGLFAVHVAAIFVWTALLVICGYGQSTPVRCLLGYESDPIPPTRRLSKRRLARNDQTEAILGRMVLRAVLGELDPCLPARQ